MVSQPQQKDTVPTAVPKPCFTCRHFRPPEWVLPEDRARRTEEIGVYGRCARFRETRRAELLLVTGIALDRDEAVYATVARATPELCGPTGRVWSAKP